jgi:hypothetical protein
MRLPLCARYALFILISIPSIALSAGAQELDHYGGVAAVKCQKGAQRHFYTEKLGDRWWLCDPAGHGYFMKGLVGVYPSVGAEQANLEVPAAGCWGVRQPAPCCSGVGTGAGCGGKYYTDVDNPYTASQDPAHVWYNNWTIEQIDRMRLWGFNMIADGSHAITWPTSTGYNWNTSDGAIPAQYRMPFDIIKNTSVYAFMNEAGCNVASPIKDMKGGMTPGDARQTYDDFGDYFDPNYATCIDGQANPANDPALQSAARSAHSDYLVYITFDNGDQAGFLLQGPDFPTIDSAGLPKSGPGPSTNAGWVALNTSPTQNSNNTWNVSSYPDHEVYSKVELANELLNEYACTGSGTPAACCTAKGTGICSIDPASSAYIGSGNVTTATAALNAAWHSHYSTLSTSDPHCSADLARCLRRGTYSSWGTGGTGLLDENGTCPSRSGPSCWIGNSAMLAGETAGMQADMNTYLKNYADRYFSVLTSAFHKYEPGILLQMIIGSWSSPPRKEVLESAGRYLDLPQLEIPPVCPKCTDIQQRIDFVVKYMGDKPWMTWEGFYANPDSSESQHVESDNMATTQQGRGKAYQQMVTALLNAKDSIRGDHHVVGFYWWDEYDADSEGLNWGLVSVHDNPYDGKSATMLGIDGDHGKDKWGYRTGGERANYGDFISAVTAANKAADATLARVSGSRRPAARHQ